MKKYLQFITENYNSNKTELDISNKKLKEFPKELLPLPSTLQILYCHNNNLTSLPELPSTLQKLYCHNNNLTSLPELPSTLQNLYCSDNKLECIIPEKFIYQQDKKWLEKYYYPMIKSYEGQKKILDNDITQIDYLKTIGLDPKIEIEFKDILKQTDWT